MWLGLFSNQVITFRSETFPNMHTTGKCRGYYFDLAAFRLSCSTKESDLPWTWQTLKHAMGDCFGCVCTPLPYTFSFKWHCFYNSYIKFLMHISDSTLNMLLNYQPHFYSGCYTAIISVLHEQNNEQLLFDSLFPPSSFQWENNILHALVFTFSFPLPKSCSTTHS